MSNYPTLQNPLLTSSPPPRPRRIFEGLTSSASIRGLSSVSTASFKQFFSKSIQQLSTAGSQLRLANPSSKRIGPASIHSGDSSYDYYKKPSSSSTRVLSVAKSGPVVHYNGNCDTLEELPAEKLDWVLQEDELWNNGSPLLSNHRGSIVLSKPYGRCQTFPMMQTPSLAPSVKPKAMFYLRVISIVKQKVTKPCFFRATVQWPQGLCMSQYRPSEKCGKYNITAEIEEVFLLDINQPCTIVLSVLMQSKSTMAGLVRPQESHVGKYEIHANMQPKAKQLHRIRLSADCDVMAVYGTYVSTDAQVLLESRRIHAAYITVYIRGRATPKWERFWAVLEGPKLLLFDFEFKETRPPLYIIPLHHLLDVRHPPTDDDERQVDVGSLGLALQFSDKALSRQDLACVRDIPYFECRMYVLPDSSVASRDWESALAYVAGVVQEYGNTDEDEEDDDSNSITSSLLSSTSDSCEAYEDCYSLKTYSPTYDDQTRQFYFETKLVPEKFLW